MRIVSTKLKMKKSFSLDDYFSVIIKWLKNSGPCKILGEGLEKCPDKTVFHEKTRYLAADSHIFKKESGTFTVFKLRQVHYEQIWNTEVLLHEESGQKTVYFHIDCSRNISGLDEPPEIRTSVIRAFVESGFIEQPEIPLKSVPAEKDEKLNALILQAFKNNYNNDIPLVIVTTYFDTLAGEIDENDVARKLAGMAYVTVCDAEYTRALKDKATCKVPYNGAVAICCKGSEPGIYRKTSSSYRGTSFQKTIIRKVLDYVTESVDKTAPTYESLNTESVHAESKQNKQMLDEFFDENETLESRLKRAETKISELSLLNSELAQKNEALKNALEKAEDEKLLIKKSPVPEFFEGEQHDLIISTLQRALTSGGTKDTRRRELIEAIVSENPLTENGVFTLETVKKIFSDGDEMTPQDAAELKRIGFEVVSEAPHYKLVYKNSKYWFTVSKSPSDLRSGKNLVSDIIRRLSVYK